MDNVALLNGLLQVAEDVGLKEREDAPDARHDKNRRQPPGDELAPVEHLLFITSRVDIADEAPKKDNHREC